MSIFAYELIQRCLDDVSQMVVGIDEVVTRVEVAVVLHGHGPTALFLKDAQPRRHTHPRGQRDIEELDYREVAERLGLTLNATRIRIHRARQALRKLLEPHFREEPS